MYDLRGDFGLDPAELRERFAFYYEAFPQVAHGGALTMPGIHRERPGAEAIAAAAERPPVDLGEASSCPRVCPTATCSPPTPDESSSTPAWDSKGPLHRPAFDAVDASPIHCDL